MIYYKSVKTNIHILKFAKVMTNVIADYCDFSKSDMININVFISQSFSHCFAIFLLLNISFLSYFIFIVIARLKKKIVT